MTRGAVAIAVATLLVAGSGYAQEQGQTADSSGCGVGTILFKGQRGVAPQVMAVTTNASLGNQTFGISSGTLGCTRDGVVNPPAEVRMLVVSSLDNLAGDVARGEGETLASLATVMKVKEQDRPLLFSALKANFTRIFPSENVRADEVIVAIHSVMAEDAALRQYVRA